MCLQCWRPGFDPCVGKIPWRREWQPTPVSILAWRIPGTELLKDGNNNPVQETAKETLMYRTVLWTLLERERVGRFGRMALKHV